MLMKYEIDSKEYSPGEIEQIALNDAIRAVKEWKILRENKFLIKSQEANSSPPTLFEGQVLEIGYHHLWDKAINDFSPELWLLRVQNDLGIGYLFMQEVEEITDLISGEFFPERHDDTRTKEAFRELYANKKKHLESYVS